jgi:hypothetical protein
MPQRGRGILLCHEDLARKAPTRAFVWYYLRIVPDGTTGVHLYSCTCVGQMKNHKLAGFLLTLIEGVSHKLFIAFLRGE